MSPYDTGDTRPSLPARRVGVVRSNVMVCVQVLPFSSYPELQEPCTYISASARRSSTVKDPLSSSAASRQLPIPVTSAQTHPRQSDVVDTFSTNGPGIPGEFSFAVKAAVNARLGLPSSKKRCPILLTDAPLFGLLSLPEFTDLAVNPADNVLPPRKHADHLVSLYWRCLDPLEPLLDQRSFSAAYQALFDGSEMECDEQTFLCTLNLVLALSTQLQESTPSEQRNSASKSFFLRAWHLLRPEVILWQAGSLEIVQCLLLMTRYLQCTPNLQQTWMALGSAVRIALSIGLDRSEKNMSGLNRENQLARDVWQQCVFMDRSLSWSLGRHSTVPSVPFLSFDPVRNGNDVPDSDGETNASVSEITQELNQITGCIGLSPVLTGNSAAVGQDLVVPTQADPSALMQIDECLTRLEHRLPPVTSNTASGETANPFEGRLILLRLRLAHTRIMFLRPVIARVCLSHLQTRKVSPSAETSIGDRVLETCATLCVENAQKLIMLVQECARPDKTGLIPWWYRIFYLYIAMQHLIAAMLRPDLFGTVVPDSWNTAASVFSAHEHLSLSVRRCLNKLQMMWQRVIDIHSPPTHEAPPSSMDDNTGLQDVFGYLGFDAQMAPFGLDDSAWLDSVDWTTWSS
ncbi:transcription factor domain-containing protein [Aspergillus fischeri NRRL 181]|uniref:Fungal specific transcription factor domain protein, putative n=1 Tax=Neosartorya fischeri (strain ATCC 1020 / DSM 3700 / CBS 544.65 / FGSC A1164 / JCM 1740 / NRRL 181 / WB 181) TaxID=331117 RepID=A1DJ12_NEOFI|nr:fungal specific transcription factor domain protein, putative [Aspergillus fischeri NRRL 181]EAW19369.1 fungal specific transcription factor domain protein, putative [Aspergillus fischeri NRRL 181]